MRLFANASLAGLRTKIRRVRRGISNALDDSSEFAEDLVLQHTLQRFQRAGSNKRAQTAPSGFDWPPPAESTLRSRKENRGGSNQALVDTGLLRDSIYARKRKSGGGHDIAIRIRPGVQYKKSGGKRIAVSTVARLLQNGFVNARGGFVPPRPFAGIDDDTARVLEGGVITRLKAQLFGLG